MDVLETWKEIWTKRNRNMLQDCYADNCIFQTAGMYETTETIDSIATYMGRLAVKLPTSEISIEKFIASEDQKTVFVYWTTEVPAMLADGALIDQQGVSLLKLGADGRISEEETVFDRLPLVAANLEQLGF